MDATLDAPAVIATLLVLAVLLGSAWLWILRIQKPQELIPADHGVRAWSIGWVNFGIFICALIVATFFVQIFVGSLFRAQIDAAGDELTPWLAVLAVLMLQMPLIGIFYLSRRFYPGHFADRLNDRDMSARDALRLSFPYFLRMLPLIWLTTLLWGKLLEVLQTAGIVETFSPQELVTLFTRGGDPLAIVLLVLLAVVMAPIIEEIIFRGCLYRFLKSQTTLLPAQILSGAFFALVHGNLLSFVPLVLVGVLLARIYEASGNILTAMFFHAAFNGFSLLMLFLVNTSTVTGG